MGKYKRIVLVNPPLAMGRSYYLTPPIGLLLVAAALEKKDDCDVRIKDLALELAEGTLNAGPDLCHASAEELARLKADIYGFSIQCVNLPIGLEIARCLSAMKPGCRIVFGGHHASLLGQRILSRFPFVNEVVTGSGEEWAHAANPTVWYTPAYERAPSLERYANVSAQFTGLVEVARGCPFECSFCSIPLAYGRRVVQKPIKLVIEEVAYLAKQNSKEIHFVDDTFTLDRPYVHNLLAAIQDARLDISWTAMTRADLVTPDLLNKMSNAGCHSLLYGIESAHTATLNSIDKHAARYPNLIEFTLWHLAAGIRPTLYFLVNLPNDTWEGLSHTLDVASQISLLDPGSCHFQLPRYVPGTRLTEQVFHQLLFDPGTPYADTLVKTVGEAESNVWKIVRNNPDLCSTYYVAPGPVPNHAANALAWTGDYLFRSFSQTMLALANRLLLADFFSFMGRKYSGRIWASIPEDNLALLLNNYVTVREDALQEIFACDYKRLQNLSSHLEPVYSVNDEVTGRSLVEKK